MIVVTLQGVPRSKSGDASGSIRIWMVGVGSVFSLLVFGIPLCVLEGEVSCISATDYVCSCSKIL